MSRNLSSRLFDLLLLLILALGGYLRVIGLDWDESQHLHPDERFMTMVTTSLQPVQSLGEYFDTQTSTLNPANRGYTFFVYGTFPLILTRYVGEWVGQTGYDEITLVGRQLSALADLLAVLVLYLMVSRLPAAQGYGRKTALLAAAFSALAVMQIQESHFYTVDNYTTLFMTLAAYFAVRLLTRPPAEAANLPWHQSPDYWDSLAFGLATGLATASKLNAAPVAILLPAALLLRAWHFKTPLNLEKIAQLTLVGAVFTVLAFRVAQPYAFNGFTPAPQEAEQNPSLTSLVFNPQWLKTIAEQRAQASGDVDFPPALQWARRPFTFSLENMVIWGLGWPLGFSALLGAAWMAWQSLKQRESLHLLLLGWLSLYVLWQMSQWNPTMRYQLPAYPLMALMAAWGLNRLRQACSKPRLLSILSALLLSAVLLSTLGWAWAFTRIYTRPHTRVAATRWIFNQLEGPITLKFAQQSQQPLSMSYGLEIQPEQGYLTEFRVPAEESLTALAFARAAGAPSQTLTLTLATNPDFTPENTLARVSQTLNLQPESDLRGKRLEISLPQPLALSKDILYYLKIETDQPLRLAGAAPINESSWDDGLPLRMDGYDAFGGIYQGELNLEMYWDDNADKRIRFLDTLNQGDYLFISSNRQWGTTVRVPERYPLTTAFYRALLGCPEATNLLNCYRDARPGMFSGQLGYDLVQVFESYPNLNLGALGYYEFNTQYAEEAFTVYDHPKVLIFKKSATYNPAAAQALLEKVDLSKVVHLTPRQAGKFPSGEMTPRVCWGLPGLCQLLGAPQAAEISRGAALSTQSSAMLLSPERQAVQQSGGSWKELFSYDSLQNRWPVLGLLIWFLFLAVLGAITYPLLRFLLPGLGINAWAFSRTAGLVLLAWMSWFPASLGGVYTRQSIGVALGLLTLLSAWATLLSRRSLREEWKTNGRRILLFEAVFLLFFSIDLLIRLGNPDLWHPSHGGERPMDFSYLNAVLRSSTFPPYDPWFAGGYINYYYYGFVLVGTPIKLLGMVPSIAYNFVLPSLYALLALGGFGAAFSLTRSRGKALRLTAGLGAAIGLTLMGNLGTIQLLFQGLQKMIVPGEQVSAANVLIFQRWIWAAEGLFKLLTRQGTLPIGGGEWFWNPSRVIPPGPGNEITEFPLFTFLYSDLHAHMIAFPLAVLLLGWALSTLRLARGGAEPWGGWARRWLPSLAFGGLVTGVFRPTNTWDFPTYLLFAALVTFFANLDGAAWEELPTRLLRAALSVGLLAGLALVFYSPYAHWFGLGYSSLGLWSGEKTPIWSYLTQWLPFHFVFVFWLAWETRQWMAQTPYAALRRLKPYASLLKTALVLLAASWLGLLLLFQAQAALYAFPLLVWAFVLLLRPGLENEKRLTLFMIITALALTLFVEMAVLSGDLGRMNTVFKLYLQAWILSAVATGAALAWTLEDLDQWREGWRNLWQGGLLLLFAAAFLFTLTATNDKIHDRVSSNTPLTLDSMEYMAHSTYWDGQEMDLSQDYRAIRWLQQNVSGSPIIVEGYTSEYRWGARYTIYTGLPDVLGWNWHQRQQRTLTPETWVFDRADAINTFYNSADPAYVLQFLQTYHPGYIIVGQMERNLYAPAGLQKFEAENNRLWREVYRDQQTVIYQVLP